MPNIKSAMKRVRTSAKRRTRNLNVKTSVKTLRGKLFEALDAKKLEESEKLYREYCSLLDTSAKKGVIGKNTAARRKTRVTARLKALKTK